MFAIGFNCCPTDLIEPLIDRLRPRIEDQAIVVYPNSGGKYDAATNTWHGGETPEHWSELALRWHRAGADMIGGCCRIGPGFIRQLAYETTWRS